jgi:hypothetical protein
VNLIAVRRVGERSKAFWIFRACGCFERLPVLEAMGAFSAEASRKRMVQMRGPIGDPEKLLSGGINMTPERLSGRAQRERGAGVFFAARASQKRKLMAFGFPALTDRAIA